MLQELKYAAMKFNYTPPTADYSYQKTNFIEEDGPRRKAKPLAEICDYTGRGRKKVFVGARQSERLEMIADFNRG